MIYIDNAATTKLCEKAKNSVITYNFEKYFNPSAIYRVSISNKLEIENCKKKIGKVLNIDFKDNIIFTGSATEANNLAILGTVKKSMGKLLFSMGEHPSVYNVSVYLKNLGYNVEYIELQCSGEINYEDLEKKLTEDTGFISIMHVSNETGAINDLKRINALRNKKAKNAIFHSDGVQAFSKVNLNLNYLGVDLYTISGHKIFGPKGIGALYVKNKKSLKPIILGGGQEYGLRSGTENVANIVALGDAIDEIGDIEKNFNYTSKLKNIFLNELKNNYILNNNTNPYVMSISFCGLNGETLVHMLEEKEIYISTGSACSSSHKGNRILSSMKIKDDLILGSIRVSFCKNNTEEEAAFAGQALNESVTKLRKKLS